MNKQLGHLMDEKSKKKGDPKKYRKHRKYVIRRHIKEMQRLGAVMKSLGKYLICGLYMPTYFSV
jgi:hypothetical protein